MTNSSNNNSNKNIYNQDMCLNNNGRNLQFDQMTATNQSNYEEEQAILNNGLRNLALRQQERIYSAGNIFL